MATLPGKKRRKVFERGGEKPVPCLAFLTRTKARKREKKKREAINKEKKEEKKQAKRS